LNELLILGGIILIGFVGRIVFKYTKVPESLFMILIGLAIGPLFHVVDSTVFEDYTALVATITLILVLLDSGITLNIFDAKECLGRALIFTLLVLVFSTVLVGAFFMFIMGWNPLYALLMGVVSSGSTTIVLAFLLPRLKVPMVIQNILFIESVVNDITLITAAVVLLQLIDIGTFQFQELLVALFTPFAIAVATGAIFAVLWVNILWKFYKGEELAYVFTVGMLFTLHSLVEHVGGNGAIAVLVLTLSLGNLQRLLGLIMERSGSLGPLTVDTRFVLNLQERFSEIVKRIKETQIAFTFLIQNFFFVYLGIIFDVEKVDYVLIGMCVVILALMFISRYLSARVLSIFQPEVKPYATIMASMVARGFTATFVALLPATKGIDVPLFKEIVLTMVLFSTIVTMVGSIICEVKPRTDKNDQEA
jgi:cell volume regulation protein A